MSSPNANFYNQLNENGNGESRPKNESSIDDSSLQAEEILRQSSRGASSKSSARSNRSSDFDFETRYVVLNFFGLVPVGPQNLNASGSSSSGNAASLLYSQASFDSGKSGSIIPHSKVKHCYKHVFLNRCPYASCARRFWGLECSAQTPFDVDLRKVS